MKRSLIFDWFRAFALAMLCYSTSSVQSSAVPFLRVFDGLSCVGTIPQRRFSVMLVICFLTMHVASSFSAFRLYFLILLRRRCSFHQTSVRTQQPFPASSPSYPTINHTLMPCPHRPHPPSLPHMTQTPIPSQPQPHHPHTSSSPIPLKPPKSIPNKRQTHLRTLLHLPPLQPLHPLPLPNHPTVILLRNLINREILRIDG